MATTASPLIEFASNDTLTFGTTATLTIQLPPGQTYRVRSVTCTGTNAGTTVTVSSGAAVYVNGQTVGNATATFPAIINTTTPATSITVVCGGAGTITLTRITLVGSTGAPLSSSVA